MGFQLMLVGVCILLALVFMAKKIARTLRNRGGCDCDNCNNKTRACTGGGTCPGQVGYRELRPVDSNHGEENRI